MKKFTFLFAALMACTAMFAEVEVPTNAELLLEFKKSYVEFFDITDYNDTDMNVREAGNFIYVMNSKGGDALKFITESADWKWLADYILSVAGAIPEGTNETYFWRANIDAFFHCKNAVPVGSVTSADFTEAGKPENWGPAYLAAHPENPTAVENTTVATPAQKIIRDGQVLMVRDGKTFNMMGQEVK